MVKFIKLLLTFLYHPFVSTYIMVKFHCYFTIGARTNFKKLKYLFVKNNFRVGKDCRFLFVSNYAGVQHNPTLSVGKNFLCGNRCSFLIANNCQIGDNCLMASDVLITTENHGIEINGIPFSQQPLTTKPIIIGDNCWIGEKVNILPGVSIGNNCIIASGSNVTKTFGNNCIIGGNPAKIIKEYDLTNKEWIKKHEE